MEAALEAEAELEAGMRLALDELLCDFGEVPADHDIIIIKSNVMSEPRFRGGCFHR